MQGEAPKTILEAITRKNIASWNSLTENLPQLMFQFLQKGLQQLLPTASNLFRWKKAENPTCTLRMNKLQSNAHMFSNCSAPNALERYALRHNAILTIMVNWISSAKSENQKLFADLPQTTCGQISDVFQTCVRPDLVLFDDRVLVLELSVCHETNLLKTRSYKQSKYVNILDHLTSEFSNYDVKLFTVEVSVLGLISKINDFCFDAKLLASPNNINLRKTDHFFATSTTDRGIFIPQRYYL